MIYNIRILFVLVWRLGMARQVNLNHHPAPFFHQQSCCKLQSKLSKLPWQETEATSDLASFIQSQKWGNFVQFYQPPVGEERLPMDLWRWTRCDLEANCLVWGGWSHNHNPVSFQIRKSNIILQNIIKYLYHIYIYIYTCILCMIWLYTYIH